MHDKRICCFTVVIIVTSLALLVAGNCLAKFKPVEQLKINDITGDWFSYRWSLPSTMITVFQKALTSLPKKNECLTIKAILQEDNKSMIFKTSSALNPIKTYDQFVEFEKPDVGLFKISKFDDPSLKNFAGSSVAILALEPKEFLFGVICRTVMRFFKMQIYIIITREKQPNAQIVDHIEKALNASNVQLKDMKPLCN